MDRRENTDRSSLNRRLWKLETQDTSLNKTLSRGLWLDAASSEAFATSISSRLGGEGSLFFSIFQTILYVFKFNKCVSKTTTTTTTPPKRRGSALALGDQAARLERGLDDSDLLRILRVSRRVSALASLLSLEPFRDSEDTLYKDTLKILSQKNAGHLAAFVLVSS